MYKFVRNVFFNLVVLSYWGQGRNKRPLIKFHMFSSNHNIDVGLRLGDLVQKNTLQGIGKKKRLMGRMGNFIFSLFMWSNS